MIDSAVFTNEISNKYIDVMKTLGDIAHEAKRNGIYFPADIAKEDYELLFQAVLLSMAAATGHIPSSSPEINFITTRTSGDLMKFINREIIESNPSARTVGWENLQLQSPEDLTRITNLALDGIKMYVKNLHSRLAETDSALNEGYVEKVKKSTLEIIGLFAGAGGIGMNEDDARMQQKLKAGEATLNVLLAEE